MNKKILMSLVVIGIVAGVTLGITGAYFSDTATSTSNSFHSGTLDLKLADSDEDYSDSITGTFNAEDMIPGDPTSTATGKIWLKNTGKVPVHHISVIGVENMPSDNGMNSAECAAYGGEWKWWSTRYLCILPTSRVNDGTTCRDSYNGTWADLGAGYGWRCFAESSTGFKDGIVPWNNIDKHLQITSIKYADKELVFLGHWVVNNAENAKYTEVDVNRNGYLDLDDLEIVAKTPGSWLHNLTPAPGVSGENPHPTFAMTVKLNGDAGDYYQTDKDGIKITFAAYQEAE